MVEEKTLRFTLQDAFTMAIYDLDFYKEQDKKGKDRIRNYRRFLKTGSITQNMMEKVVRDYGFECMRNDRDWETKS